MIGLPDEDLPAFHAQGRRADHDHRRTSSAGYDASQWLYDYFQAIIAERRADPREDLISVLVQAELDGQRLTDDEIIAFLRLLLPAGAETTYRSSSNLMFGLLTQPRPARRAAQRPVAHAAGDRGGAAVGAAAHRHRAHRDARRRGRGRADPGGLAGAGRDGAANRDPSRWDNPDAFDILREQKQHMAFAFGPHMCLGMHLARMETTVVINAVLDRCPNLRLDPDAEDVHISGLAFRAPTALPVLFG